nr:zinc finger protein ZIC 5-like [Penaeus vannamei]
MSAPSASPPARSSDSGASSPKTSSPPSHKSFSISSILSRDDPKKEVSSEPPFAFSHQHDALRLGLMSQMTALAARHPLLSLYPDLANVPPTSHMSPLAGMGVPLPTKTPWYPPWALSPLAALASVREKEAGSPTGGPRSPLSEAPVEVVRSRSPSPMPRSPSPPPSPPTPSREDARAGESEGSGGVGSSGATTASGGADDADEDRKRAEEEDADGVLAVAGVPAGEHVRHEALPVVVGARGPGGVAAPDGDAGQDLVPEPPQQVEAAAGGRAGGRQHGARGAAPGPRAHPLPRRLHLGRGGRPHAARAAPDL